MEAQNVKRRIKSISENYKHSGRTVGIVFRIWKNIL